MLIAEHYSDYSDLGCPWPGPPVYLLIFKVLWGLTSVNRVPVWLRLYVYSICTCMAYV